MSEPIKIYETCVAFCEYGWNSDVCLEEMTKCTEKIKNFQDSHAPKKCEFESKFINDPRLIVFVSICK